MSIKEAADAIGRSVTEMGNLEASWPLMKAAITEQRALKLGNEQEEFSALYLVILRNLGTALKGQLKEGNLSIPDIGRALELLSDLKVKMESLNMTQKASKVKQDSKPKPRIVEWIESNKPEDQKEQKQPKEGSQTIIGWLEDYGAKHKATTSRGAIDL